MREPIQAKTGLAQSTVSAYMAELHRAGLVHATRVGKWTHYRRDEARIARSSSVLGDTICSRLHFISRLCDISMHG